MNAITKQVNNEMSLKSIDDMIFKRNQLQDELNEFSYKADAITHKFESQENIISARRVDTVLDNCDTNQQLLKQAESEFSLLVESDLNLTKNRVAIEDAVLHLTEQINIAQTKLTKSKKESLVPLCEAEKADLIKTIIPLWGKLQALTSIENNCPLGRIDKLHILDRSVSRETLFSESAKQYDQFRELHQLHGVIL